jgi:hypothetical protein
VFQFPIGHQPVAHAGDACCLAGDPEGNEFDIDVLPPG